MASKGKPSGDANLPSDSKLKVDSVPSKPEPALPKSRLTSLGRIGWILGHRKMLNQAAELETSVLQREGACRSFMTVGRPGEKNQSQPVGNVKNLKPILLKEMEAKMETKTQFTFKGRIINLMSIDDASVGQQSTRLVVEDEAGDTFRVCIYGYPYDSYPVPPSPDNLARLQNNVGFGSKFSIVNPYMKMAVLDGNAYIRVDNPATIIHHPEDSVVNRCRFCGVRDAPSRCAKCRRHYCSRECQKNDWKINQHQLICALKFRDLSED